MFFDFYIGGYLRGSYTVQLKENLLYVREFVYHQSEAKPFILDVQNDHDWAALIAYLANKKWKGAYDAEVCDGTQWRLKVRSEMLAIDASGSNAYPRGFKKLLTLLNKVTEKIDVQVS
jgi:hypothetical protein